MLQKLYEEIKNTKNIPHIDETLLYSISDEQKASLFCLSLLYKKTDNENLKTLLLKNSSWLIKYENILKAVELNEENCSRKSQIIIKKTLLKETFSEEEINNFVEGFTSGEIPLADVSFWSMLVCQKGLSEENTYLLTIAMTKSGNVYDYKKYFPTSFFTRRYPTGGVSEKIALLLPTMLMSISDKYDIKSPFTVARSLGFTGGTWDKMSSIPDFKFPNPGLDSIDMLKKCNVSMTVSKSDMCPADRILYQLRSLTGSVESVELAASSIASKQLAIPCDYLILDTRYGSGAFFDKKDDAMRMSNLIKSFLIKRGISVDITYTDTPFPKGSSIGNPLEVEEAFYILTGNSKISWNIAGIKEQKKILFKFLSMIMKKVTGDNSFDASILAENLIQDGTAKKNLEKLLLAHGVSEKNAKDMLEKSFAEVIGLKKTDINVISNKDFTLRGINQRDIGNLVNFELGGARYEFGISEKSLNGILLYHRPNDLIKNGDTIFSIYSTHPEIMEMKREKILKVLKKSIIEVQG